ncbi:MAG: hypothetical protein OXH00_06480 [Candidatus Poribacteria bacterium]|nr:hypothetical protein [Candidatus Poribacteria bacterium]
MKSKRLFLLFVILAIVVGGVVFFKVRPQYQALGPQEFAKLPEKPALLAKFNHGPSPINSVVFSPVDASLVASAGIHGIIKLWNINNTDLPLRILNHPANYTFIAFSPNGELLASAGNGEELILWDVASGNKVNTIKGNFGSFAFSPDGDQLATSYKYGKEVKLWNIRNPKKIIEVATLPFDEAKRVNSYTCTVDISPDGKLIVIGYANGTVNVWNLQTKQHVKTLKTTFAEMEILKFSPNNRFLVCSGPEGYMRDGIRYKGNTAMRYIMWSLPEWQRHNEVQNGYIENFTISPDGKMCARANTYLGFLSRRGVEIWSTASGATITSLPTKARDVAFSPDGKMLATAGEEGILRLWEFTPQQLTYTTAPADVIRIVYLLPKDKEPRIGISKKLDKSIRKVQDFYAKEMERHGFGRKTFGFETDENGRVKIYFLKEGQIIHYDMSNGIWLAVAEDLSGSIAWGPKIIDAGHNQTFAYPKNNVDRVKDNIWMDGIEGAFHGKLIFYAAKVFNWKTIAYTLREAFGLSYDDFVYEPDALKRFLSRVNSMMPWEIDREKLSKCEAEWLDKSRFFNPNQPFFNRCPEIEMSVSEPDVKNSRRFQFEIADEDGIYQAQLFVSRQVQNRYMTWQREFHEGCHLLNGKKRAMVEFRITDAAVKDVELRMIDIFGNIASRKFQIKDETSESPENL